MDDSKYSEDEKFLGTLSLLFKEDAAKIVVAAKDGLKSDMDTHNKLGLSKKQYYTRLRQLNDYGILHKDDDTYRLTIRGQEIVGPIGRIYKVYGALVGDLGDMDQKSFNNLVASKKNLEKYFEAKDSTSR